MRNNNTESRNSGPRLTLVPSTEEWDSRPEDADRSHAILIVACACVIFWIAVAWLCFAVL